MVDPGEGDLGLLRGGGHSEQFNSWKGQLYYLYIRLLVGYSILHNYLKGREVTLSYPIGAVLTFTAYKIGNLFSRPIIFIIGGKR